MLMLINLRLQPLDSTAMAFRAKVAGDFYSGP